MWATLFGGNGTDQIYSVACDYNNNVFVSGLTWSQSQLQLLKPPSGYFQPSGGGAQSGLIAGFDVNAKLIWSTYFGNAGSDCRTITCDGNSNIYVAGAEGSSAGFPFASLPGAYNNCSDGYYVSVFCSGFKQKWCSSFQPGQYIRKLCASKSDGGLLVSGYSVATSSFQWNKDLNATLNSFFSDVYSGGNSDGFLTLLNPDYSIRWSTLFGSNGNDQITSAAITISGKIIVSGYTDNTANSIAEDFPLVPTNSSYFQNNLKAYNPAQIFVAAFDSKVAAEPEKLLWSTMVGDSSAGREIAYSMDVSGENLFIAGNAFLEPAVPSFPLVHEPNGFLQTASNPIVSGFNASGSNGLILKFNSEATGNLRLAEAPDTPQLYPNPCTDKFIYLKNDNNIYSDAIFQIHDASGRCIKQFNSAPSAGQQIQIDLEGLVKGYYTLSINKKNNNDHLKFMRL